MNLATGAWMAAAAGLVTGCVDAYIRQRAPSRKSVILLSLLGALLGAATYAVFIGAGFAVSLLTFSGSPDPWPALVCVLIGCAGFLLVRGISRALASSFGLPRQTQLSQPPQRRSLRDLLDARPRGGRGTMWVGGVGFALLPLLYGLGCILTRKGDVGTLLWPSAVEGPAAIALGIGWVGIGLFLHFHFFFGLHPRLASQSRNGKLLALIVAGAGLTAAGAWSVIAQVPV